MMKHLFFIMLISIACLAQLEEITVEVQVPNRSALRELTNAGLMIENYNQQKGTVLGIILDRDLEKLETLGYPFIEVSWLYGRKTEDGTIEPSGYPLHSEYVTFMRNIATAHPVIAKLDTFGYSVGGRPLLMMKISNRVARDEAEPEFCYISTMHGNEAEGMILLMWFIDSLINRYGSDPRITRLVDSCEIFINPLLNPDGYVANRRTNNNSIDLNRNFPVPDGTIGEDGTWTNQPETQAMIDWYNRRNISYSMNFHTGALVVNYPWDYTGTRSLDDSLYKFIAYDYASRNPAILGGGFPNGITNGYDWYEADGTLQDWTYWQRCDLHLTTEIATWPITPWENLPALWSNNYDAFLATVEMTLRHGVRGIVTDSITGESLSVNISITPSAKGLFSAPNNGYYHRILLPGTYFLTFSKIGYRDKTVSVVVPDTGVVRCNVQLAPLGRGIVRGNVRLAGASVHDNAIVLLSSPTVGTRADTTNISGHFEFTNVIPATDYTLTASKTGYADSSIAISIAEYSVQSFNLTLYPFVNIYFSDFEANNGGLATVSFSFYNDWEWGVPTTGPGSAHSGAKLWATRLNANYRDSSQSRLILRDIALPPGSRIQLVFWQWYRFQTRNFVGGSYQWHDGGNIKLWRSPADSTILSPNPDYDTTMSSSNLFIRNQRAYADSNNGNFWHQVTIDLTSWAGQTISISWDFGSSSRNNEAGWYIDDIVIRRPDYTAIVSDEILEKPEIIGFSVYPNPFNSRCRISINSSSIADAVEIYDMAGRLVRVIPLEQDRKKIKNERSAIWDCTGESGEYMPSGIYLIKLKNCHSTVKAVLIR